MADSLGEWQWYAGMTSTMSPSIRPSVCTMSLSGCISPQIASVSVPQIGVLCHTLHTRSQYRAAVAYYN